MFTILSDGNTMYAPTLIESGYVVASPKLTKEVNKAGSLEFTLPATNPAYSNYSKMKSLLTVEEDETKAPFKRIFLILVVDELVIISKLIKVPAGKVKLAL